MKHVQAVSREPCGGGSTPTKAFRSFRLKAVHDEATRNPHQCVLIVGFLSRCAMAMPQKPAAPPTDASPQKLPLEDAAAEQGKKLLTGPGDEDSDLVKA